MRYLNCTPARNPCRFQDSLNDGDGWGCRPDKGQSGWTEPSTPNTCPRDSLLACSGSQAPRNWSHIWGLDSTVQAQHSGLGVRVRSLVSRAMLGASRAMFAEVTRLSTVRLCGLERGYCFLFQISKVAGERLRKSSQESCSGSNFAPSQGHSQSRRPGE